MAGIFPSGERFKSANFLCQCPYNRLQISFDVPVFNCLVEVIQNIKPHIHCPPHRLCVDYIGTGCVCADSITGNFRVVKMMHQGIQVLVSFWIHNPGFHFDSGYVDHTIDFLAESFDSRLQILVF